MAYAVLVLWFWISSLVLNIHYLCKYLEYLAGAEGIDEHCWTSIIYCCCIIASIHSCSQHSFIGWTGPAAVFELLANAKSLQSCPTLCDPIDGSPPGSPVPGILQARTLEWIAISFSNARKWKVKVKSLSRIWLLATPWTAAYQAPPSMGYSRQEYWSAVPLPSPKKLPKVHEIHEQNIESNFFMVKYKW